jgi:hypothetical protein
VLAQATTYIRGAPKGGGAGLQPPQTPPKPKFKKITNFLDMISKALRDLPFSRNQPLNQLMTVHWNFGK